MRIKHILVQSRHLIRTILTLYMLCKHFDMSANFPDKGITGALENQADREVGIILLLLQASVRQPILERDAALLLARKLLSHDFGHRDFTHDQLFLEEELLLKVFVLLHHAFECERDLFAALDDLLPQQLVLYSCVLESLQH